MSTNAIIYSHLLAYRNYHRQQLYELYETSVFYDFKYVCTKSVAIAPFKCLSKVLEYLWKEQFCSQRLHRLWLILMLQ